MRVGFELAGAQPHAPMRHELEKSPDDVQHGAVSTLPPVLVQRSSGEAALGAPDAPDFAGAALTAPEAALVAIAPEGSFVTGAVLGGTGVLAAHAATNATNAAAQRVRARDFGATLPS